MLQRPQTLLFIAAAILSIFAAFAPIASYSTEIPADATSRVKRNVEKMDPKIVVKPTDLDFHMNYVQTMHGTKKRYIAELERSNKMVDEEVNKRGISTIFTLGSIGCILLALAILLMIFLFKNRKLQIRVGVALILLTLMVTTGIFIGSKIGIELFSELEIIPARLAELDWKISYNYGFFLFPAIAVCLTIGVLMIRKDDNLVKSLDRLR